MELSEAGVATPLPVLPCGPFAASRTPCDPSESTWAPSGGSMPSAPSPASSELAQLLDRIRQLTPLLSDDERLAASRALADISASCEAEASASPPRPLQISLSTHAEDDDAAGSDEAVDDSTVVAQALLCPSAVLWPSVGDSQTRCVGLGVVIGCECERAGHYTGFRTAEESRASRQGRFVHRWMFDKFCISIAHTVLFRIS